MGLISFAKGSWWFILQNMPSLAHLCFRLSCIKGKKLTLKNKESTFAFSSLFLHCVDCLPYIGIWEILWRQYRWCSHPWTKNTFVRSSMLSSSLLRRFFLNLKLKIFNTKLRLVSHGPGFEPGTFPDARNVPSLSAIRLFELSKALFRKFIKLCIKVCDHFRQRTSDIHWVTYARLERHALGKRFITKNAMNTNYDHRNEWSQPT
jgi:hypothetical protein